MDSRSGSTGPAVERIREWLVDKVAETVDATPMDIDPALPFDTFGVTSTDAVSLSGQLEEWLDLQLEPTLLYAHPTINDLAAFLSSPPGTTLQSEVTQNRPEQPPAAHDPVCVVGMACRLPAGADTPALFWENLANGVDAAAVVPADRWDADSFYSPDPDAPGRAYTRTGAFVHDLAAFDTGFFGISPREALRMDPRQRLLLETSWAALEDAGLAGHTLRRSRTGVFVGMMADGQYTKLQLDLEGDSALDDPYLGLGSAPSVTAGRIAYHLDLRGPCLLVDTACSSALVATHLAAESLLRGETDVCLVGGVSATLHPDTFLQGSKMRMLAPDGRCKTFDAAADGFLMGEGCGVVVLERRSDALARGHQILAVLRGSAMNQDGMSNGLTAPNGQAQVAVIQAALDRAGCAPHDVDFVEAHGSGTLLGDSIELTSLQDVFGPDRAPAEPLIVGAVKTNIGHLIGAAGIAGLIKTILALRHDAIPANLHCEKPSDAVAWDRYPVTLPATTVPWPVTGRPRVAGVSSFGWSGTNAHLLVEEAPPRAERGKSPSGHVLLLSARSEAALPVMARELLASLGSEPEMEVGDVAFTTQIGRKAFDFRATIPCRDLEGARAALEEFAAVPYAIRADRRRTPAIALLLPGSGEQYVGMGRALYETEQVFRDAIGECAGTLAEPLGLDLREVIYPADPAGRIGTQPLLSRYGEPSAEVDSPLFQRTDVAHAAVFAVDYACAKLWQHYGVSPTMLLGYSLGEYVAACLAGVFSLEDALRLVVRRAQLLRDTPSGAMLAVAAPVSELQTWLGPELSLAARNGPMTSVVSGTEVAVEALCTRLTTRGVAHRRVPTAHAMHSSLLEPMRADVSALVASVPMRAPRIPFVSNVTGTWITPEQACDPDYWAAHMCRTVLFASGVTTLAEAAADVLLETGPGQLASLATQTLAGRPDAPSCLSSMPGRLDRTGGREFMLRTAARLWTGGVDLDWSNTYAGWLPRVVSLPTYPFERQRFWPSGAAKAAHHPGSGSTRRRSDAQPRQSVREWLYEPQWRKSPSVDHAQPEGPYLIFGDELGLGSQLTAKLADIGRWVTVRAGAEFAEIDHDTFEIRPGVVADYMRLMERLAALGRIPRTVVHLWSVTGESEHTTSPERIRALQRLGFESVLHLGRALAPVASAGARLLIVTDGAQRVDGGERVDPGKATIVGPCLSLAQEYPGLACRIVDLPAVSSTGPASQDHLFDELRWPGSDTAIAYRAGERYVEEYVPVPWDGTASGNVLRDGGTYLITGGLGNMGLLIARHIATRVRGARLVLVGRTGLPPRETWSTLLEDTSDPALAHRVARVRDLTATGAEVLVVAADVADAGDMRRLVERVRREIGPINGVVHAAGITAAAGFAPVADMAQEITDGHFAAKVFGTLALSEALANEPLDFCVLQSSISAVLGGLGFAAYAGANAFLDRFAQAHDHTGRLPWRSVAWDTWQATISETAGEGIGDSMAVFSMTPEEGLQVFDQVIASGGGRTVVSTGSLGDRVHKWTRPDDPFEGKAEVASAPLFARPQIPETYIPAKTDYERRLAGLWRVALGIDGVGVNDNFFELGGNSLVGTQLVSAIRKEFQTSVPVVALFEAPTVRAMGKYLMSVGEQPVIEEPGPAAQMSERVPQVPAAPHDGIAIIGMAGRFPGAMNTRDFWENLSNGVESIRFFTEEELVEAGVPAEVVSQPNYIKARPVLDGIDLFDAEFFGYSPWEARLTDPQHRIFLESVWEALETAGYAPRSYPGSIGVFAGTNISTYIRKLYDDPDIAQSINDYQVVMSNDKDALTTTASYKLNLRGPSVAVQTFCSTSMVAVHLACQALRGDECDMAVAGGVSIRVPDRIGHLYQEGGMETPDGHVRTFDADAHGSIFGDGSAVVVLKRLADAMADGDTITAVIKGTAINNDGALKVGFTAPSVSGQAEAISRALSAADVDPATISYVEAHGTATELGDPIEVTALTKAFGPTPGRQSCAIGSVKTNVGHLDRAAGVTGLIKTALSLQNGIIPPTLHYRRPNPEIDFEASPFYVTTEPTAWPASAGFPRRACVNSLGMGGTNAHAVLQEAPAANPSGPGRVHQVLPISARTEQAADEAAANLVKHLRRHPDVPLADVAFTLQTGRETFAYRRAVICTTVPGSIRALDNADPAHMLRTHDSTTERPVGFVFTGAGDLSPLLRGELYDSEPTFRHVVDECAETLLPLLGTDIRAARSGEPNEPAAFVAEYALARLLMSWGVHPDAMLGFGLGEYVGACLAGILTLDDALLLVAKRTELAGAALTAWAGRRLRLAPPQIPYVSGATGTWIDRDQALAPGHWAQPTDEPARFSDSMDAIMNDPDRILLCVGLDGPIKASDAAATWVRTLPDQGEQVSCEKVLSTAIATLWLHGVTVDWEATHGGESRRRVPLPTYPFQRQRYWIDAPHSAQPQAKRLEDALLLPRDEFSHWFYLPGWRQAAQAAAAVPDGSGAWVVFADAGTLADELIPRIEAAGIAPVVVRPGDAFARTGDRAYTVEPESREDYVMLLKELAAENMAPCTVTHLWAVEPAEGEQPAADRHFHGLMALAQALGEAGTTCALTVVSASAYNVTGDDRVNREASTVTGPCKVIPFEYPTVECRHIDMRSPANRLDAAALWAELTSASADLLVALRGGRRWVPHYERLPVESVPATSRQLREDGVYMITGGLGGIGMAMAANLAATVHARLVLVGRHGLPDPADWDGLLDDAETPETLSRRVREVRSLRAAGAEVLVIKADISDRAQMRDALDQAVSRFGRLDGVIHAAGLPGVGLTQFKTHQDTSRVLAAKVTGTRVLLDCLADVPVDFVVLFSSITSLTGGGPGQIDYCAANAYLDACAQSGAGGSTRIVAINWGEWRWNAWDDTLAGLDEATRGFLRANRERIGIRFEEGWQALLTALDRPEPQLIVSSQDFPALMDATSKLTARALLGAVGEGHRSGERHPRPQLNTPFVAPDGEQACRIAEIWAQTLGVAEIGVHDNFFDLGGNSLLGIDLVSRMRDALRCDTLVPHILYEAPTVAELVRHVNGEPDETAAADERRLRGRRRREALGKGRHR